jgi:NAD(P)-dependent dehydrogenase (short-subunit alcohol dehydrogenase family)
MKVLITGATGGLGQALASAFRNAGAELLLTGRRIDPAEGFACDLAQPEGVDRLIAAVRSRWESLDVLINNAGVLGPVGPAWENDWQEWEATVHLNLLVPVKLCRGLIPMMTRGGSIINISGGGAASPRPNFTAYGTAKAALVRFSETLAVETGALGIRVNCIAPGIMRTRMVEQIATLGAERSGAQEFRKAREVMTQGGTPPETPAELAVMLASEHGRSITGKLLSAAWDPWRDLAEHADDLRTSDVYTLRRVVPADRHMKWGSN